MALLIAIGDKMPSTVTAFVFGFVCLVSLLLQIPFRPYKSNWMNLINIIMEIQNLLLALICIVVEVGDLTYDSNRQFGLAMIGVVIVC